MQPVVGLGISTRHPTGYPLSETKQLFHCPFIICRELIDHFIVFVPQDLSLVNSWGLEGLEGLVSVLLVHLMFKDIRNPSFLRWCFSKNSI